jgi:hypothetical protein
MSMDTLLDHPVSGPGVWNGQQMRQREDWIVQLSSSDIAEIDQALTQVAASKKALFEITATDFRLPTLAPRLHKVREEIETGRGFALIRGLPIERYTIDQSRTLFWGIASQIGSAEGQDKAGNLMHQVTDTGKSVQGSDSTRGFETNNELQFHNDGGDAFMLLCIRSAQSGGTSKLMSVGALFNEMLRRRPDLARVAQEPFHFDSRAQNPADLKVQSVPILTWYAGRLNALHKRRYIETAQRFPEVPRLTPQQWEVLDLIDEICADPAGHLSFDMQPGDMQIASNFSILHSRTEYQDFPEADRRRLLLRIWMTLPQGRPLPQVYASTREFGQTWQRRQKASAAELA